MNTACLGGEESNYRFWPVTCAVIILVMTQGLNLLI